MTANQIVVVTCLVGASFLVGRYVGQQPAIKPCPQAGKAELIRSTVTGQVCTYATIERQGRKFKWEVRKI